MKRPDVELIHSRTTFELSMWPTSNPHILAKSQEKIVLCDYIALIEKENLVLRTLCEEMLVALQGLGDGLFQARAGEKKEQG